MPRNYKITKAQVKGASSTFEINQINNVQTISNTEDLEVVYSVDQNTCKEFVAPQEQINPEPCPTCTPNPDAIVPDWTTIEGNGDPFLNEQNCLYSVVIETKYNSTGGDELVKRIKEYKPVAAKKLLRFYSKKETDLIVDLLVNGAEGAKSPLVGSDYFVPTESAGRLKILYVIPAFNFDGIEEDYKDPTNTLTQPTIINEFSLQLNKISMMLNRFQLVMGVYGKYQARFHSIDDGRIYYGTSKREFIIGTPDSNNVLTDVYNITEGLNYVLERKGFNQINDADVLPDSIAGFVFDSERVASNIKFNVDNNYKIVSCTIEQQSCPPTEITNQEELDEIFDRVPFNNPTVMAYLSRIEEIHREITAREPMAWLDFIKKYTYPALSIDYGSATLIDNDETLLECITSAINDSLSTLSNSVIDKIASFPNVLLDKYMQDIDSCRTEAQEVEFKEKLRQDLIKHSDKLNEELTKKFFAELDLVTDMKKRVKSLKSKGANIKSIYTSIINDYGYCGIFSLLNQSLECLASGMSFADYINQMVEAALKNLSPKDLTLLLKGLPLDKRLEVSNKVKQQIAKAIEEGLKFPDNIEDSKKAKEEKDKNDAYARAQEELDSETEAAKQAARSSYVKAQEAKGTQASEQAIQAEEEVASYRSQMSNAEESFSQIEENKTKIKKIEEEIYNYQQSLENLQESLPQTQNKETLKTIKEKIKYYQKLISELESELYSIKSSNLEEEAMLDLLENGARTSKKGTIGKNGVGKALGEIQKVLVKAYVSALMDVVGADDLMRYLKSFPGADIVTRIFSTTKNCVSPPSKIIQPGWNDFFKTVELDFCRNNYSITLPKFPKFNSFFAILSKLIKKLGEVFLKVLEKVLSQIILSIVEKILSLLTNGLCSLLSSLANVASGLAQGQSLLNVVRNAFGCDPLTPDDEIAKAVQQIFGGLGAAPTTANSTIESTERLMSTISNTLNTFEMVDLLKGNLEDNKLASLKRIIAIDVPEYAPVFNNESSINSVFSTLGTLIPQELLNNLEEQARQAVSFNPSFAQNSSVCPSPERLEEFDNLRASLLAAKGLDDDQIKHQLEQLKNRNIENVKQIALLATAPDIGTYIASQLPPLVSTPSSNSLCSVNNTKNNNNQNGILPSDYPMVTEIANETSEYLFNSLEKDFIKDILDPQFFARFDIGKINSKGFFDIVMLDVGGNPYSEHNQKLGNVFLPSFDNQAQYEYFNRVRPYFTTDSLVEETYFPETVSKELSKTLYELEPISNTNSIVLNVTSRDNYYESFTKKEADVQIIVDNSKSLTSCDVLYNSHVGTSVSDTFIPNYKDISRILILKKTISKDLEFESSLTNPINQDEVSFSIEFVGSEISFKTIKNIFNVQHTYDEDLLTKINNLNYRGYVYSPQSEIFDKQLKTILSPVEIDNLQDITNFYKKTSFDLITKELQKFILKDITFENQAFKFGSEFYEEDVVKDEHLELDPETLEPIQANPRVKFLDSNKYGGTEEAPAVYIEPRSENGGWLGILQSCIPEPMCEPKQESLFNFDEIKERVNDLLNKLEEDERIKNDPECITEPPYGKLLSKISNSFLEGVIQATIRIYVVESILKSMPVFTKYIISFPNMMDEVYVQYICENIENGLLNQDGGFFSQIDDEYYLLLLEQAVQVFGRRIDMGEITPTDAESNAVGFLNEYQTTFKHITNDEFIALRNANNEIKFNELIGVIDRSGLLSKVLREKFNNSINIATSINKLRKEMRLQAIRDTKNIAKVLLNSLIKEQLTLLTDRMKTILLAPNKPTIDNIHRHMLSSDFTKKDLLNDYFVFPSYKYSYFDVASNLDDTPFKFDDTLVEIIPEKLRNLIVNGCFILERYIKLIDKEDQTRIEILNRADNLFNVVNINDFNTFIQTLPEDLKSKKISEIFGDLYLDTITNDQGEQEEVINGTTIGVKYGLRVSFVPPVNAPRLSNPNVDYCLQNKAYNVGAYESNINMKEIIPLASAEIDLQDGVIGELNLFEGNNSFDYECLLNKLITSADYKLIFNYCFPMQRFMSLATITIDNNFMYFLGVDDGWKKNKEDLFTPDEIKFENSKKNARNVFEVVYNSQQYDYESPIIKRERQKINESIKGFLWGNNPFRFFGRGSSKARIVADRPYDKLKQECKKPDEV